jgi:hypothetical protein
MSNLYIYEQKALAYELTDLLITDCFFFQLTSGN